MIRIYNINKDLDKKVVMDVDQIDGQDLYNNFHLYLAKNYKTKFLVYNYLKLTDEESVNISYLHDLFKDFDNKDYFLGQKHKNLLKTNSNYKKTFYKCVKLENEFMWGEGQNRINAYTFDAKYMMLDEYHSIVFNATKNLSSVHTHEVGAYVYTRSLNYDNVRIQIDNFFKNKKKNEDEFFGDLFSIFNKTKPDFLTAYGYSNYIEIYDTTSQLLFRVTLNRDNFHDYEMIFPTKKHGKDKTKAKNLAFNFVIKQMSVAQLLNRLMSDSFRLKCNAYLKKQNELTQTDEFEILQNSVKYILEDLRDNNKATCLGNKVKLIQVRDNMIERNVLQVSDQNNFVRLHRNIEYTNIKTSEKILEFKSYFLKGDYDDIAKQLIMEDFVNIHKVDSLFDMTEYKLISENKLNKINIFMKEPIKDILDEYYYEYESIQNSMINELEMYVKTGEEIVTKREPNKIIRANNGTKSIIKLKQIRFNEKNRLKVDIPMYDFDKFNRNRYLANKIENKFKVQNE